MYICNSAEGSKAVSAEDIDKHVKFCVYFAFPLYISNKYSNVVFIIPYEYSAHLYLCVHFNIPEYIFSHADGLSYDLCLFLKD